VDEGVHADDFAFDIEEWAATVSWVDEGVGLDVIFVEDIGGSGAEKICAIFSADPPNGETVFLVEGGPDGTNELSDS